MKARDFFETSFVMAGAFIGAGFISGGEIVSFFYGTNTYLSFLLSGALFFILTFFLLSEGSKYNKISEINDKNLGKLSKFYNFAIIVCSVVTVSAMLAGLDSLAESVLGVNKSIPILSGVAVIVCCLISERGVKGLSQISVALVPFMIIAVIVMLFIKGQFSFENISIKKIGVFKPFLYVSMNMFLSAPVIALLGEKKSRETRLFSALFVSVILLFLIAIIYGAIIYEGQFAVSADMPLLYVFSANPVSRFVFSVAVFIGIFTTLLSAFYPLYRTIKVRYKRWGIVVFCLVCLLISRIGMKNVIKYLYTFTGVVGLTYFFFLALFKIKNKVKNKRS